MAEFFKTFIIVALSEFGDKSQLLSLALAVRYKKPFSILLGVACAASLGHGLAILLGREVLSLLPEAVVTAVSGVLFLAFSIGIFLSSKNADVADPKFNAYRPFVATFVLFFLAELGDKTQIVVAILAAQSQNPRPIFCGAVLAMLVVCGLSVFLGIFFSRLIPYRAVKLAASGVFLIFGLSKIVELFAR